MSETNRKPLDVVKFYYNLYKEYEKAYENTTEETKSLESKLKEVVESSSSDSQEFKDIAKKYIRNTNLYTNEIVFAANKFLNAADFFIKTNEEDLPDNITKEYVSLKKREYKPSYSIEKGKYVENVKQKSSNEVPQQEFDLLFNYYKQQFGQQ